jgi:TonB family protein
MFTGIIESLAKLVSIEKNGDNITFTFNSKISNELKIDQSLAHNGICLTVIDIKNDNYSVVAIKETVLKTSIKNWKVGDSVNIERAMKMGARLDGHMVQGHVDQIAVAPLLEGCEELEGDESRDCFENGVTKHISENFKYPRKALKNQIEGDVFIQFSIDEFGFLIDFTTVGPDKVLEDEAYRIMSTLRVKKPAQLNGKNVKMTYGIPISFRIN